LRKEEATSQDRAEGNYLRGVGKLATKQQVLEQIKLKGVSTWMADEVFDREQKDPGG